MDPHQHQQQQQQQEGFSNPYINVKINPPDQQQREQTAAIVAPERVPQWSQVETAELLAIRAELDASFLETKRNKPLWDSVSARMHAKGFPRTPDQCKSKWKNLLTRFKGSEAMEAETSRTFPFQEEMQRIFSGRMERLLSFEEEKGKHVQPQTEEYCTEEELQREDEEEEEEEEEEETELRKKKGKRRRKRGDQEESTTAASVKHALRKIIKWQAEMDERWFREWERRETERRLQEEQWRRSMHAIQQERIAMEEQWRAREEERRAREEERAERRHDLITAILTRLAEKGL